MAKKRNASTYSKAVKELYEKLEKAEEERKKSLEALLSKLFYKIFDNEENEGLLIFLEENSGNKIFIEELQDITSGRIIIKEEKKEEEITNRQPGD